ncbi:RagB/SusD family nutrient uptake outer membrane protein [Parapedobacter deserti]|uniref:RagB/SusD family nutrient uptake outer membrane protein n=1 Tax=Parapedobacter deserti TaxID=1912957 RepID=A0ABV7JFV7_9SPHI
MKKIKISHVLTSTALVLVTMSCGDLDRFPFGEIEQSQSFQSVRDARTHNNGLYAYLRGRVSGLYQYSTDIQADQLNASLDFGNRNGNPHRWEGFLSDDYTIRDTWSGYYSAIANLNNQIEGFEQITPGNDNEVAELNRYKGDAYLARAFYYLNLTLRFAKAYNPSTASSDLGVPLVLTYDISLQPARSTVAECYAQILQDIETAKGLLANVEGEQGATRFTSDAVLALEARVKLYMQDFSGARTAAQTVINSGTYPLLTTQEGLTDMWHRDLATEVIFQPHLAAPNELGNTTGSVYLGYNAGQDKFIPDFIPSQWVIDAYDDEDHRKSVYFENLDVLIQGTNYTDLYLVNKYPGNPELFTGAVTNYQHHPKVFRVAELYLIVAEAAVESDPAASLAALNTLRQARGLDALGNLSGQALMDAVKTERFKELAFEGFRLDDLKRWGEGFTRRDPQDLDPIQTGPNYQVLSKQAGDNKFVWGIPLRDQTVNPNISNQQNPGW